MGTSFGRIFRTTKNKNTEEERQKEKHNPRNVGSTQSLNVDYSAVPSSPNPNTNSQHEEQTQTISIRHSSDNLTGEARPVVQTQIDLPPYSVQSKDNHNSITPKLRQTVEYLPGQDIQSIPPRSTSSSFHDRYTSDRRHYVPEEKNKILKENRESQYSDSLESEDESISDIHDSTEWDSRPKMRADRNIESNDETVIRCKEGDILQLINYRAADEYYFVKNLRTDERNVVPKAWVTLITNFELESHKGYFKEFNRRVAERKLRAPEIEIGTYLLRPSRDGHALSLRSKNKTYGLEIKHYKIGFNGNGQFYIDGASKNKTFSSIVELISYYTEEPDLQCKLKKPLPRDLVVHYSDLELGQKLGTGNFASVYAGTLNKNKQVAVKSLRAGSSMTVKELRKEAETMSRLRHKNLVSLLGICEYGDNIYIITERMSRGALLSLLRENTEKTISFNDLMDMAIQVVEGMCYLEKKKFVHRDLRAANVLVGKGNITKIADFGLARLLSSYYGLDGFYEAKHGSVFPYKWTAPEAIKQRKFTVKSDVWSFGILLYEMVTFGDEPYYAMNNADALEWLEKGYRLQRPTDHSCPLTLYNIMKECWLKNPDERPNFAHIKDTLAEIQTKHG